MISNNHMVKRQLRSERERIVQVAAHVFQPKEGSVVNVALSYGRF